jgi:hypothetical protein
MKSHGHGWAAPMDESGASGGGAGGMLAQAKQTITQGARDAAAKIKSTASDSAARAKQTAERVATEKKETAAGRIGGYSSAMHESARSLEEKDPNIAHFTHQAADRLQAAADYVRGRDFAGLREDAEGWARRHPAAFFGGLFFAGLILGNVVKASRPRADDAGDNWEPEGSGEESAPMLAADGPSPEATAI